MIFMAFSDGFERDCDTKTLKASCAPSDNLDCFLREFFSLLTTTFLIGGRFGELNKLVFLFDHNSEIFILMNKNML